jgi:hypothetical protein
MQNTSYIAVEMADKVVGEISTAQLAQATGLSVKQIQLVELSIPVRRLCVNMYINSIYCPY